MKLTVIGCSGSFPGPDSSASCYLVTAPHEGREFRLVLDLGSGALGPLQRHISLCDIDAVALSHLHADHCLDLCSLYVARKYHPNGCQPRIPVYGPPDTSGRMARAYDLPEQPGMTHEFDFIAWETGRVQQIGPFAVTVAQMAHPVEAYAVRIEHDGRVLVFSGDTGPTEALVDLAGGADLLLCEASFLDTHDNPADLHLTGSQAAEHATRAGVGRLVLTHIPPWHDPAAIVAEAKPEYGGPLELARPGAVYEV